jgi:hypothetical protein
MHTLEVMQPASALRTNDGVAILARGNTISIVYQSAARLHRSRWLFDALDQLAAENPDGILGLMVILPTADPPDAATRAENSARLRKLGTALGLMVTVPVGDALWLSIVRTMMRALYVIQGKARAYVVSATLEEGLDRLLEAAGPLTPSREQIKRDLDALHAALGVKASWTQQQRKAS